MNGWLNVWHMSEWKYSSLKLKLFFFFTILIFIIFILAFKIIFLLLFSFQPRILSFIVPAFSSFSSVAQLCLTSCYHMDFSTPGFPVPYQLPELAQTHVHRVSDAIQPSHPLPSPSPPALNLSHYQGLFKRASSSHQVSQSIAKYCSFSCSICPSNEYSGLISFRMDWLDLLAVQGTLKSLLQHHSSEESILQLSAFFIVQLSHPYVTTGKPIALTIGTSVSKVIFIVPHHKCFRSKAIPCEKCSTAQTQRMDLETGGTVGRDILITVLQGQVSGGQAQVLRWDFCPLGTQVPPLVPHWLSTRG